MLRAHATHHQAPGDHGVVRARLTLVLLIAGEAGALAVLVRLGRSAAFGLPLRPDEWTHADPLDALAATVRCVAVIATAWLLLVTLVAVVATAASAPRRPRGLPVLRVAHVAPGAIRHLVEHAVVSGLALGVVTLPAATASSASATTAPAAPVVTVVRDGRAGDLTSLPAASPAPDVATAVSLSPTPPTLPTSPGPPPMPPPAPDRLLDAATPHDASAQLPGAPRSVLVAPGEHLWELAVREVARVRGVAREAVDDDDVARYWAVVCDANRDRLRSGDVDVVFVGETVVLPPV